VQRVVEDAAVADVQTTRWVPNREPPVEDVVTLRNGDTLTGFIAAVTPTGLRLERDGGVVPLRWDALSAVRPANPSATPDPAADVVTLRDGSRVHARAVTLTEPTLRLVPTLVADTLGLPLESQEQDAARREVPAAELTTFAPAASGLRLVPLTELSPRVEGGEAFGLSFPPKVVTTTDASPAIWLRAPTTLTFDLPTDAVRLTGTATLPLPPRTDPAAAALASVQLVVAGPAQRETPFAQTLMPDEPTPLRVPLSGRRLELRVTPGSEASDATTPLSRLRLDDAAVLLRVAEPR
jgi:hypothetical protein